MDIIEILKTLPFPVSHNEFSKPTPAPCMVYVDGGSAHIHADSINAIDEYMPSLELYCRPEDEESPRILEELLKNNNITYTRSSTWVSSRKETEYIYELD